MKESDAPKNPKPVECDICGCKKFELIQGNSFGPLGFRDKSLWHWECVECGDTTSYLNFN